MPKGDFSRLVDYLNKVKFGDGLRPRKIILSQDNIREITGSKQKSIIPLIYKPGKGIKDWAEIAGYSATRDPENYDFIFT